MTSLANTRTIDVFVLSSASGVTEKNLVCLSRQISPDQGNVSAFRISWIIGIVLDMAAMTVKALDILALAVVIHLSCVAVGADIDFIRGSGGNFIPARIGTQKIAVAGADVLEAVNVIRTPRVGRMYPVAG